MASPAVRPPQILPADFNGWDKTPPATLPADFAGFDPPASSPRPVGLPAGMDLPSVPSAPIPAGLRGPAAQPGKGLIGSALDSSGLSLLSHAIAHPIDTFNAIRDIPNPNGTIQSAVKNELGRSGAQLKEAWNTPNNQPLKAIDRTLYAIPGIGGVLKTADDQAAAGNWAGAAGSVAGLPIGAMATEGLLKGAQGVLSATGNAAKGAGLLTQAVGATPESLRIAGTRALVPGAPSELLTRALKPTVAMPDFEQSLENSLPTLAKSNPKGVQGISDAANAGKANEQAWYNSISQPFRGVRLNTSPIADAQMHSIPTMDIIEKPATATSGSMKTFNVPAGDGGTMRMAGQTGGDLRGGIIGDTADKANNYRRDMRLGLVDDIRKDSNAKLQSFYQKSGGDQYAALSNPETARIKAVNDASRDLVYDNLSRLSRGGRTDAGIPVPEIAANQKLFGNLSDVAQVAGKRATVAGRANPMSLQETMALKPSPMGVLDYIGQRTFKGLTNSDALANAAMDRYSNPNGVNLLPRTGVLPSSVFSAGKGISNLGGGLLRTGKAVGRSRILVPPSVLGNTDDR